MLDLDGVTSCYGPIRALKDVSIMVGEDEIVAIIGANGAGKSTLLNTVSGLVVPIRGRILFRNRNATRLSPEKRVALGLIQTPEGRQLFHSMSVRENLQMGSYLRYWRGESREIEKDLDRVLSLFPILGQRTRQLAGTLSGGEQQMLAIGRSLMGRPRLLLLDEPSLGLAPLVVREIFRIIARLHQERKAILLVEQNAREALRVSDRAYVLETGSIRLSGSSETLSGDARVKESFLGKGVRAKTSG